MAREGRRRGGDAVGHELVHLEDTGRGQMAGREKTGRLWARVTEA